MLNETALKRVAWFFVLDGNCKQSSSNQSTGEDLRHHLPFVNPSLFSYFVGIENDAWGRFTFTAPLILIPPIFRLTSFNQLQTPFGTNALDVGDALWVAKKMVGKMEENDLRTIRHIFPK